MSAPALRNMRKGWCPSLFEPMESGDGLIVRIKPSAATIDAGAMRALVDAAALYGNGIVELTNRANIQLRGVRTETLAPVAALATRLRLAAADPAVERIRSVMASPLGPDDPTAGFDSHALAADIERMLAGEPRLIALPAKFGFVVDGGGALPLDGYGADITLRPAAGGIRIEIAPSAEVAICSPAEVVSAARRLALAFLDLAPEAPGAPRRMGDLVQAIGAAAVFAAAGLETTDAAASLPVSTPLIGVVPVRGASHVACAFALPFGQIEATRLAALIDLAVRYGDGTQRVTPWRALVIARVAARDAPEIMDRVAALGLVTDAADPRLAVTACPGRPACASATVATRADAALLAGAAHGRFVHVSGCAKGCAHPGPAAITLVGHDGRYDMVLGGRASDTPARAGLTLDAALAAIAAPTDGREP